MVTMRLTIRPELFSQALEWCRWLEERNYGPEEALKALENHKLKRAKIMASNPNVQNAFKEGVEAFLIKEKDPEKGTIDFIYIVTVYVNFAPLALTRRLDEQGIRHWFREREKEMGWQKGTIGLELLKEDGPAPEPEPTIEPGFAPEQ